MMGSSNFTHYAHTPKQPTRMGHRQQWTTHEKQVTAIAYQKASIDPIIGTDETLAICTMKLVEFVAEETPTGCESS